MNIALQTKYEATQAIVPSVPENRTYENLLTVEINETTFRKGKEDEPSTPWPTKINKLTWGNKRGEGWRKEKADICNVTTKLYRSFTDWKDFVDGFILRLCD